jgi:hypothetical protein
LNKGLRVPPLLAEGTPVLIGKVGADLPDSSAQLLVGFSLDHGLPLLLWIFKHQPDLAESPTHIDVY